ncbi:hypothetical protein EZ313_02270 [Ramlibacter henchirensis]|uniref:Uncharacterized protein n=1 Tax=Ramlibacter henchirensis TaxID=204072 RepID=A0A4Z0C5Y2_9BURK|nr:hypothetical protein EZ313_02270 [Ramlibacter henchirensis]
MDTAITAWLLLAQEPVSGPPAILAAPPEKGPGAGDDGPAAPASGEQVIHSRPGYSSRPRPIAEGGMP